MASNEVWGIDIGKAGLKAVKMKRQKDQVEIVAIEIIEYEQPSEAENVDKEEQIRQALVEFKTRNKIKNEKIYLSIPGQATFNRLITIPPVDAKRIREIVSYEAQQQIPFPLNDVLWDYQLIGDQQDKQSYEREVMLFAVRREIINNFLANLAAADIPVHGIQIASVAIYNFIRYEKNDLNACVAIDIGAENTDLIVVDNDKLWLRALPFAGNDITKALQKRFNIPYGEAEKLKLKSGKTKQAKKIFEVMKPVLKDIVGEIHRSVGYFKSMSKDVKFERMIFLGNATKLAGFQEFFSQNLQYDIEVLSEIQRIHIFPKINVNLFQTNITTFAVAIGLALQGLNLSVNKICLLPEEIALKANLENQKKYLLIAVILLAIVPAWLYYSNTSMVTKIAEINNKVSPVSAKKTLDQFQRDVQLKRKTEKEFADFKKQITMENYGLYAIQSHTEVLKTVSDYQKIHEDLQRITQIGKDRRLVLEILNSFHNVLIKANETIRQDRLSTHKIWLIDLSISKEGSLPKTNPEVFESFDPIYTTIKVAYKTFKDPVTNRNDPVKNRDYIVKHIREPLAGAMYQNQKLFSLVGTPISEDLDTLFPSDTPESESYHYETLTFETVLNKSHIFTLDNDIIVSYLTKPEPESIKRIFQEYGYELSDDISVKEFSKDVAWIVSDNQNHSYMIVKTSGTRDRDKRKGISSPSTIKVYSIVHS